MRLPTAASTSAEAVTPSDTVTFGPSQIFVGGAGTVAVRPVNSTGTVTLTIPAGTTVPLLVTRVLATGTSATLLVRLF